MCVLLALGPTSGSFTESNIVQTHAHRVETQTRPKVDN